MNETITIPVADYVELVRQSERVNALVRLMASGRYIDDEYICAVLDIPYKKPDEGNI